jgi:DnaJ-class molecular chaperone
VQTPTKLTKRQKELLHELGTTLKVENNPQKSSLFGKVKEIFS